MMGERSPQGSLFAADTRYLEFVGRESFYGFLGLRGRELFRDADFAGFYCTDNGRRSVPPSLLAMALLLQTYDGVSDAEAKQRADFDLRWKVALGVAIEERPFAKSTRQLFRAQLVIHGEAQSIFRQSLQYARTQGYLGGRKMRVALDTTAIFGRGAVEDTYNLIGHGVRHLCEVLAERAGEAAEAWAATRGLERYFASSLKATAEVDWDDAASREAFLTAIVRDGERVLALAREARSSLAAGSAEDQRIVAAAELLMPLLWPDVEPTEEGYRIKPGTAKDRVPSVHDPEQRHGRKSHGQTFTGHKGAVAVDTTTPLVTAVEALPGTAPEGESAAALVAASEANTGSAVEQVIGDTAYGSLETREALGERAVIAPTVHPHRGRALSKSDFDIDVPGERVRCPEGHETTRWTWATVRPGAGKPKVRVKRFHFPQDLCRACPRYADCVTDQRGRGRTITLHPDEERLQAARAFEQTDYFREQYRRRVVVEHRIARLVQRGVRQSRFRGRTMTAFELLMAATVANLTLVAGCEAAKGVFRRVLSALQGLSRRIPALGRATALWRTGPIEIAA